MSNEQRKSVIVKAILLVSFIAIIIYIIISTQSNFTNVKQVELDDLETDTKKDIIDSISRGEHKLVTVQNKQYIVIASGGKSISPYEYEVSKITDEYGNEIAYFEYWFGDPDGQNIERYLIFEVEHSNYKVVERKKSLTVPVDEIITDAIITHINDDMIRVYSKDYGILNAITKDTLSDGIDLYDIQDGIYSVQIQSKGDYVQLNGYTPIDTIYVDALMLESSGVYDTIQITNGDRLRINNRTDNLSIGERYEIGLAYKNNEFTLQSSKRGD